MLKKLNPLATEFEPTNPVSVVKNVDLVSKDFSVSSYISREDSVEDPNVVVSHVPLYTTLSAEAVPPITSITSIHLGRSADNEDDDEDTNNDIEDADRFSQGGDDMEKQSNLSMDYDDRYSQEGESRRGSDVIYDLMLEVPNDHVHNIDVNNKLDGIKEDTIDSSNTSLEETCPILGSAPAIGAVIPDTMGGRAAPNAMLLAAAGTLFGASNPNGAVVGGKIGRSRSGKKPMRPYKTSETMSLDVEDAAQVSENITKSLLTVRSIFLAHRWKCLLEERETNATAMKLPSVSNFLPCMTESIPERTGSKDGKRKELKSFSGDFSKNRFGSKLKQVKVTEKTWCIHNRENRDKIGIATIERKIMSALNKITESNAFRITCNRLYRLTISSITTDDIPYQEMCKIVAKSIFAVTMTQPNNTATYAKVSNWLIILFTLYEVSTYTGDIYVAKDKKLEPVQVLRQAFTEKEGETTQEMLERVLEENDLLKWKEFRLLCKYSIFRVQLIDECQATFNFVRTNPFVPPDGDEATILEERIKHKVRTRAITSLICQLTTRNVIPKKIFQLMVWCLLNTEAPVHLIDAYATSATEINICLIVLKGAFAQYLDLLEDALKLCETMPESESRIPILVKIAKEQIVDKLLKDEAAAVKAAYVTECKYMLVIRQCDVVSTLLGKEVD